MWFQWLSLEGFNSWHDVVKEALGIPYPGRNSATGEIDETAQWTTSYTEPVIVSDDDVRAFVETNIVEMFSDGLGVASQEPEPPVE